MLAKLVGEGYEKPHGDAELPVDVNYAKLSEWLVDRKQVPADWNRKLQAIQAKVAEAAKGLPPGFLGQFDGGDDAPLDYFRAKQVLSKLTESAERGLLGSLKGSAGAWERVVKAYEGNMLHMAEAGLTLARNADYEVPYYRKLLAKNQQVISDLERRQVVALKSSAAAAVEFRQECAQLGLDEHAASGGAAGLRAGLAGLTAALPQLMEDAVGAVKAAGIGDAVAYYGAFVAMGSQGGSALGDLLPALDEVRSGRTEAVPPGSVAPASGAEGKGPEVAWDLDAPGAAGDEDSAANGMSWDLDAAAADAGGGGIAWEVDIEPTTDVEGVDTGGDAAPIAMSWDIDVSGAGEESAAAADAEETHGIDGAGQPSQQAGSSGASYTAALVAAPAEVQRLCVDGTYRARLLDDLHELRAFLQQRCSELFSRTIELTPPSAPEAVAAVGPEAAADLRSAVGAAIAALSGEQLSKLVSLACSARFRESLLEALLRRAGQERKFERAAAEAAARRAEVQRHLVADSARLGAAVRHTREVKTTVEAVLGARLGRRVNVQGEINSLLVQH